MPFSAACGAGTCSNALLDNDDSGDFEACRNAGTAGLGAPCTAQWDCAADMNCHGKPTFTCHLMCDATHPCGDAGTCTPDPGLANGGGLCQ